jgi:site-specific DNA recombinase
MRVAIYGRVSTSHQVDHQTIEQQLERLTAHVRAHAAEDWALNLAHVFRDDGYSGAVLARPGLDRLRDAVKAREVDRVLVTAPDRLARNYVHQMVLLEEGAKAGCAAEFLDCPMSDDPHDHRLRQIRGAGAEYERTLMAERMRRGRIAKLRAGLLLPWTDPPYGYRLSPDRPRDPRGVTTDPSEAAVVAELLALYREPGTSLMQLAMPLDARGVPTPSGRPRWSSPTIRGILRNPTYTGQVYAQRTRYRPPTHRRSATHPIGRSHGTAVPQPADTWLLVGQVPAVVSQAHFDEVQAKLATNRSFARRNNTAHQYLLRALVSCGCCDLSCTARAINGRNFYYLCNGKGHSTFSHRATCCPARHTPADQLDELVWKDLCALLAEPEPLAAAVARAHGCRRSCSPAARRCAGPRCTCLSRSSGSPMPISGQFSRLMSMSVGAVTWSSACRPWPVKKSCCATTRSASSSLPASRRHWRRSARGCSTGWPRRPSSSAGSSCCCSSTA